jgi:3-methyladenine DNA glycosylase AlkD
MTPQAAMKELKTLGTAQNRKVFARHGVGEAFGVSFANLYKLAKKIGLDHELACKLWDTGNHDARLLAAMVADPEQADAKSLDKWARETGSYVLSQVLAGFVAKTKHVRAKADKWAKSKTDLIAELGWCLLAHMAQQAQDCPDAYFAEKLDVIEGNIHSSNNRARHGMNMALCAIGIGRDSLRKDALAVAKRIGKVEVDHGDTSCKTPDATAYIKRAVDRKKKRKRG